MLESEFKEFISKKGEIERLCAVAVEQWNSTFNRSEFLQKLKQYQSETMHDKKLRAYFKDLRKAGMYLRTSFRFFDRNHEEPESLAKFVNVLGGFNDRFFYPDLIQPFLLNLQEIVESDNQWGEFRLTPDSSEASQKKAKKPIEKIKKYLDTTTLSSDHFHSIRKKLRMFANVYTLAATYDSSDKVHGTRDLLLGINRELGEMNDELVQAELRGETDYSTTTIEIPEALRGRIRALLSPTP